MEHVFDDLIGLQRTRPRWNWRAMATTWALRLAGNLTIGVAIGVGIAVGMVLAGLRKTPTTFSAAGASSGGVGRPVCP